MGGRMFDVAKFTSLDTQTQLAPSLFGDGLDFLCLSKGRTALVGSIKTVVFSGIIGNPKLRSKEDQTHETVAVLDLLQEIAPDQQYPMKIAFLVVI